MREVASRANQNASLAAETRRHRGPRWFICTRRKRYVRRLTLLNLGRNTLRSDGIGNIDLSIAKNTRITESKQLQFRLDWFNLTNTRNFGIPEARVNNDGFAKQSAAIGESFSLCATSFSIA